jgi:hypothetical protein
MPEQMNPGVLAGTAGARADTNAQAGVADPIPYAAQLESHDPLDWAPFFWDSPPDPNPFTADHIWSGTVPIDGTPGEVHLRAHGVTWTPRSIRFHPAARHPDIATPIPAICAGIEDGAQGALVAVRIHYLFPSGVDPRGARPVIHVGRDPYGPLRLAGGSGPVVAGVGVMACLRGLGRPGLEDPSIIVVLAPGALATLQLPGVPRDLLICPGSLRASSGFAVCLFLRSGLAGWRPHIHPRINRAGHLAVCIDGRAAS